MLIDNRARIYKLSRKAVSNAVSGGKHQQSSLFRRYTRCFGRPGYNNFTIPKAKTKGSKKRNGGSNVGNLNGESEKETMLSEMRVSG